MRRPTRTHRLSIAAIASLLLFLLVAGAGVRSIWRWDTWGGSNWQFSLLGGRAIYVHISVAGVLRQGHWAPKVKPSMRMLEAAWKFDSVGHVLPDPSQPAGKISFVTTHVPLWPFILLLIIPALWLFARPANAPAFPVIADAGSGANCTGTHR